MSEIVFQSASEKTELESIAGLADDTFIEYMYHIMTLMLHIVILSKCMDSVYIYMQCRHQLKQ